MGTIEKLAIFETLHLHRSDNEMLIIIIQKKGTWIQGCHVHVFKVKDSLRHKKHNARDGCGFNQNQRSQNKHFCFVIFVQTNVTIIAFLKNVRNIFILD